MVAYIFFIKAAKRSGSPQTAQGPSRIWDNWRTAGTNTYSSTLFFNPNGNPLFPNGNSFSVMLLRYPNPANGLPGSGDEVMVADISSYPPALTTIGNLTYDRITGNLTLLADGEILASGGSSVFNQLTNVAYRGGNF